MAKRRITCEVHGDEPTQRALIERLERALRLAKAGRVHNAVVIIQRSGAAGIECSSALCSDDDHLASFFELSVESIDALIARQFPDATRKLNG